MNEVERREYIDQIRNIINENDYPDEVPKSIVELFEGEIIADAPDLLAEVKRLREENSILKNALRSLLKDKHAEVWYEVNKILQGDEE